MLSNYLEPVLLITLSAIIQIALLVYLFRAKKVSPAARLALGIGMALLGVVSYGLTDSIIESQRASASAIGGYDPEVKTLYLSASLLTFVRNIFSFISPTLGCALALFYPLRPQISIATAPVQNAPSTSPQPPDEEPDSPDGTGPRAEA